MRRKSGGIRPVSHNELLSKISFYIQRTSCNSSPTEAAPAWRNFDLPALTQNVPQAKIATALYASTMIYSSNNAPKEKRATVDGKLVRNVRAYREERKCPAALKMHINRCWFLRLSNFGGYNFFQP